MNQVPKGQHGVDIMRGREWYLSGHAKQHRQTILLSSFATAEANALFNRRCVNHAGKARLKVSYKVRLGMFLSAASASQCHALLDWGYCLEKLLPRNMTLCMLCMPYELPFVVS